MTGGLGDGGTGGMKLDRILVVGGGTMGRGIAGLCALSGFATAIYEADPAARGRLRGAIEDSWRRAAEREKVSAEMSDGRASSGSSNAWRTGPTPAWSSRRCRNRPS
jgi:3-hydroxyacyl-CoA dehydrogenase